MIENIRVMSYYELLKTMIETTNLILTSWYKLGVGISKGTVKEILSLVKKNTQIKRIRKQIKEVVCNHHTNLQEMCKMRNMSS